jgi:diacylglycerol kinase family enzyme
MPMPPSAEALPSDDGSAVAPHMHALAERRRPRVDVIFNPVSGCGDARADTAAMHNVLQRGYDSVRFHVTTPSRDAGELARDAVTDGARVIVAAGGDGTITAVVRAVRNAPQVPPSELKEHDNESDVDRDQDRRKYRTRNTLLFGVVPRGTANALCAVLGIPTQLDAAAALINRAPTRRIDVAVVNGSSSMLLQCGIGLEAEAVLRADRSLKNRYGPIAYQVAGILPMYQQKHFTVDVTLHDVRDTPPFTGGARVESKVLHLRGMKVMAVTIANAAPSTSVLAHGIGVVSCDDGLLEFVVVSSRGVASLFHAMLDLFRSALLRKPLLRRDVFGLRARRVDVTCYPPQRVVVDGEDAGYTPVTIEIDPDLSKRQIELIAPKAGIVNRRNRHLMRTLTRLWRNLRGIVILYIATQGLRKVRSRRGSRANDGKEQVVLD